MMTPERWRQIDDVLQGALDCPKDERASFLDEACAGDAELKDEAASLLRAHDEAGDFIEQPAIAQDAKVIASAHAHANIGSDIGHYKIVSPLGAGGMGEVYLARDTRLNRLVALKLLPPSFGADDIWLRRFQREARAASALNHPNIITIHEVGLEAEARFIATEFIDGQTLRALVAERGLSLEEILDIAVQVASALVVAHAAGIVHRDIKPENIMRRPDGIVKILDFGIAKLTEQQAAESAGEAPTVIKAQTEAGVLMGTVGYMSPEQARALEVDARTDIWSLGVVLYEMIERRAPFACATRADTLVALLEREPPPLGCENIEVPPATSASLQRLVSKALSKEKEARYQTAAELLADLEKIKLGLGTGATSTRAPRVAGQRSRRYLYAAAIVVALLLATLTGTVLYKRLNARRAPFASPATAAKKLYAQMSEREKLAFISEQEQRISLMMGDRPARLNDDALRAIKDRVDDYAARTGSTNADFGKEGLEVIYARATPHVPLIARSFAKRKVPVIVGIYLPMIESEYKLCFENGAGAKGMFQFLPQTARQYGVAPEEMCDAEKMTPAAAHYIADRMAELGDDAESMTLVLLSYNRGPEWVRSTLRRLRDVEDYQRNFWTLFANRDKLDDTFRRENARYVPTFFAAAIIGENPQAFGLRIAPLSSLSGTLAPV